jgi:spore coat protein X
MSKPYTHKYTPRTKSFDDDCCDKCGNNNCRCSSDSLFDSDDLVIQDGRVVSKIFQGSEEVVIIRDSCNVNYTSTDTQVAVVLQTALQTAVLTIIQLAIADENQAELVTQSLLEKATIKNANRQKVLIEGSQDVTMTTTDTDVAISIQVLIQLLTAVITQIDIL